MNKRLYYILPVLIFALILGLYQYVENSPSRQISELRKKHSEFLKQQKPEKDEGLSRLQKIQRGLPPNQYYKLMEYLTMNPVLGYPEPYKVRELHEKLLKQRKSKDYLKAPGDSNEDKWISRGPNNVGGRTRVLLFDPNDATGKRVFAGAISGGLWVNNDITNEASAWHQVAGLPANLNVSCLTLDPRDNNIWYAGTGEQYTGGDVVGTGVYKTTDGGKTWENVLDVEAYAQTQTAQTNNGGTILLEGGMYYINDIKAWDNGSSTEVFIGVSSHLYANAENPRNILGYFEKGLYHTKNGGDSWSKLIAGESFNDFEIDPNGNIWAATTYSGTLSSRGGKVFKREPGENTSFEEIFTVPDVLRTEIESSATNPQKFYILAEGASSEEAEMWITTDAFATIQPLNEPADVDHQDIPASDFARGQAFYNLLIEADPTNDSILYVGGINLFRSGDSGQTWEQISKWSNNNQLEDLPVSLVHADHHAMEFRPGNENQAIFGHDGGVSFAKDLSAASTSEVFITPQTGYITTQFYSIAVAPGSFATGDYFLGGTQDNGSQLIQNGNPESLGILGGDGAHSFYDQTETDYFIANLIYNNLIVLWDYSQNHLSLIANNEDRDGYFINPQGLDSALDKLYSNGPEGTLYRYDNLSELAPVGEDGITDDDEVATRTSLKNPLLDTSISAITVSPFTIGSSTVLVGLVNGKLLQIKKADGDPSRATWKEITGPKFVGSISDIEYGKHEGELFVTFYNYGVRNIWYTQNALDQKPIWIQKEGNLPDLPVLSILPNPLNEEEVIIGTELGIWATKNFGANSPDWSQSYNGMSDVKVTDLDLKKGMDQVFAASYGRGMFSGQFTAAQGEEEEETEGEGEKEPIIAEIISIYPTASYGDFNIESGANSGRTTVSVYDLQGRVVKVAKLVLEKDNPVGLNLSKEASGLYFVRIQTPNKTLVQKVLRK